MGEVAFRSAWSSANLAFYADQLPGRHFATAVRSSTDAADAIAADVIRPGIRHVTDLGADDGLLLEQLIARCPDPDRIHWQAVDLRPRPSHLDGRIDWIRADVTTLLPRLPADDGVVIAHELLDDLACDVVECDESGEPHLLVIRDGEREPELGPSLLDAAGCALLGIDGSALLAWLDQWWPELLPFGRYEIGLAREQVWIDMVRVAGSGVAIAVDYGHVRADRSSLGSHAGTLTGFARGRAAAPRTDGSVNVTADVAFDALAAGAQGRFDIAPQSAVLRQAPLRVRAAPRMYWLRQCGLLAEARAV
jgi:SAM-dependent MidA family methyltransferase